MYFTDTTNNALNAKKQSHDALLSRVLSPAPVFSLHDKNCVERRDVEQFIEQKFRASYGAEIHEFMPVILSMRCLNQYSGTMGIRRAAGAELFLEQYLDDNIETTLAVLSGEKIQRRDIVEIGNLVAGRKGPSQFVFLIVTSVLRLAGYKWITFTATQALANNLNKLGFPMLKLADASIDCLANENSSEWGSYYSTRPQVFAGSLAAADEIIRNRPLFSKVMAFYQQEIISLAHQLHGK